MFYCQHSSALIVALASPRGEAVRETGTIEALKPWATVSYLRLVFKKAAMTF
jgi:hypothetical protein